MSENIEKTILFPFLSTNNIPVPDNRTPDTEMASVIKKCIAKIIGNNPETLVNEANMSNDLHMNFPQFMQLYEELTGIFKLESEVLNLRTTKILNYFKEEGKELPHVLPSVGEMIAMYEWMAKPDRGYLAFNMKNILQGIREKIIAKSNTSNRLEETLSYINSIPDDIAIEDMSIYKNCLSKYTVSPFLHNKRILTAADDKISRDDSNLLLRLVFNSYASTYDVDFNKEKDGLELSIHAIYENKPITKKISDLRKIWIQELFVIYLSEQLLFEYDYSDGIKKEYYNKKIQRNLMLCEQKMRELEKKYFPEILNDENIDDELDRLLNS